MHTRKQILFYNHSAFAHNENGLLQLLDPIDALHTNENHSIYNEMLKLKYFVPGRCTYALPHHGSP